MPLIHHVVTGQGRPPIVFVHGLGCTLSDWDAQVAHLSPRHQTVVADPRGHGASPGTPDECSIERYGADVSDVIRTLALPPAVLVGHSMGCRVAIEAALQAPTHTGAVVLVDGSQFAPATEAALKETFAGPDEIDDFGRHGDHSRLYAAPRRARASGRLRGGRWRGLVPIPALGHRRPSPCLSPARHREW